MFLPTPPSRPLSFQIAGGVSGFLQETLSHREISVPQCWATTTDARSDSPLQAASRLCLLTRRLYSSASRQLPSADGLRATSRRFPLPAVVYGSTLAALFGQSSFSIEAVVQRTLYRVHESQAQAEVRDPLCPACVSNPCVCAFPQSSRLRPYLGSRSVSFSGSSPRLNPPRSRSWRRSPLSSTTGCRICRRERGWALAQPLSSRLRLLSACVRRRRAAAARLSGVRR